MDELLSLKWSNHCPTFINMLSILREKELYTDATLACNGKFYNVHKLVLSTCSDYFSAMLDQTNCKNPVVVLKDVKCQDLEALLDYMYLGEVVVRQSDLSTLIKAAEGLRIKGLAVPDDETLSKTMLSGKDCTSNLAIESHKSPPTKRKRISDEANASFGAKEAKLSAPTHSTLSRPKSVPHSTFTSNSLNIAENSTTSPSRLTSRIKTQSPYMASNQCKITSNSLDADTIPTFDSFENELNLKKEKDSSDGSDLCFVEDTCKEETSESRDCLEESQSTKTDTLQEYLSQINSNQRNNSLLSPSSNFASGFNNNDGLPGWRTEEEEAGHILATQECQSQISTSAAITAAPTHANRTTGGRLLYELTDSNHQNPSDQVAAASAMSLLSTTSSGNCATSSSHSATASGHGAGKQVPRIYERSIAHHSGGSVSSLDDITRGGGGEGGGSTGKVPSFPSGSSVVVSSSLEAGPGSRYNSFTVEDDASAQQCGREESSQGAELAFFSDALFGGGSDQSFLMTSKSPASETGGGQHEAEIKCSYCPKTFNFQSKLERHVRAHTNERPFQCSYCPYRAKHRNNLKTHCYLKHRTLMTDH